MAPVWVAVREKVIGPGPVSGLTLLSSSGFLTTFGVMALPGSRKRILLSPPHPPINVGRAGARGAARTTCQMSPFLNIDRGVRGVADQSKGGVSPFSTLIGGCGGPKKTVFQPPEEPYAQKRSKTQRKIHIPLDPIYSGNHLFSDIDPYYRQGSDLIKEL